MYKTQRYLHEHFVCINCGNKVTYFPLTSNSGYFLCKTCHNVHLRQNSISIFLPNTHENKKVFDQFLKKYSSKIKPRHLVYFIKKFQEISKNIEQNWEDWDIKFWNKRYLEELQRSTTKSRLMRPNLRDITRKAHLFNFVSKDDISEKIICEIGTGDARTIRNLLSPNVFPYFYIPTDYSYQALLLLKRLFKNNKRVYYIQCLGERLPFQSETIDYLVILGVLHHMPKKETHIDSLTKYVRRGGQILIDEPYFRDSTFSNFIFKHTKFIFEPKHSAHEERPSKKLLLRAMEKAGEITHIHHFYSPIMTVSMLFFNRFSIFRKGSYTKVMIFLDQLWLKTIGKIFPAVGSGECLAIIKKRC